MNSVQHEEISHVVTTLWQKISDECEVYDQKYDVLVVVGGQTRDGCPKL